MRACRSFLRLRPRKAQEAPPGRDEPVRFLLAACRPCLRLRRCKAQGDRAAVVNRSQRPALAYRAFHQLPAQAVRVAAATPATGHKPRPWKIERARRHRPPRPITRTNRPPKSCRFAWWDWRWRLPSSSYFSNYEVFIAEKAMNKVKSQLIKLVYVSLPYQRRLSEYGLDTSKVLRLHVRRDSTCDESLLQMTWPENDPHPDSQHPADSPGLSGKDRSDLLPCYRTTADDNRKELSRAR